MNTGIVKDRRYLNHGTEHTPPETPQRLASIYEMLENPDVSWKYTEIAAREAEVEEIALFHRRSYIDLIASTAGKKFTVLDPDTVATPDTYAVARLAVGGFLNAIDSVLSGEVDNAFAIVRPPGHHAQAGDAAGFCIFNNMVLGALHALERRGLSRILVVDWDLHHGNGTQAAFYEDRRVLYFSTHQYPAYPGTGALEEVGRGEGRGYTVNVPLRGGIDDAQYIRLFRRILAPVARQFRPELILLSAGFDIYCADPLGEMKVTPGGFAHLARILLDLAAELCGNRFAVTLEGGYHVGGLTRSVRAVLHEMWGDTHTSRAELDRIEAGADPRVNAVIERVRQRIEVHWPAWEEKDS